MSKEKVLVVGGGFGGVKAALDLAHDDHYEITLLSNDLDLKYYPTLYRTATGTSKANSAIPLKSIFSHTNVDIKEGTAKTLDRKAKTITTESGDIYSYDYLILALGVVTNYFGIPGLDEFSYGIKSQEEVKRFKDHLHQQLTHDHRPDLNYVIVGAGPTGIELAGALPGYLKKIMKNHSIPEKNIHIDIVEAMPRLLPNLPAGVSRSVKKQLDKLGIKLFLNSKVEGETADALTVNGKPIKSHTVIWTAGVTNNPFFKENNFVLMGRGKVGVNAYLETEPGIYVIGDNANTPYSGLAQTAIHDGAFVAENLKHKARNKKLSSYKVVAPISVIPSGPRWAVVLWGHIYFQGLLGYLLREAADIRGFKDLEPWSGAIKQYLSEFSEQEDCNVCSVYSSK
jgi:NADH dehydrogenase